MSDIPSRVEEFIRPHIPAPCEIYAVDWKKTPSDYVLQILIDKAGGIEINETAELAEIISPLLDQLRPDPFPKEGYMLEVASPGAERPLKKAKDFAGAIGEQVLVSLYQKLDNQKELFGNLVSADEEKITLEITDKNRQKTLEVPLSLIAKAQTIIKF